MSNSVSDTLKKSVFKSETDEVFVMLVSLAHPDLMEPIRVCSDAVNVTSNGNLYIAFPFEIVLPDSRPDVPPQAQLKIDNIDQQIVQAIRTVSSPLIVTIEVVIASDLDTVELTWSDFQLVQVDYDKLVVSGILKQESFLSEPFPYLRFTPNSFPGIF